MARLVLQFESATLKEIPLSSRPVTIGRAPDNDLVIDNMAVSNNHSRIYSEAGRLVIEDLNSLNGTFVNDVRIERATLRNGDSIQIGKHHIIVDTAHDAAFAADAWRKAPAPKVNETMVLDTRERRAMLQKASGPQDSPQLAAGRLRLPTLHLLGGRADQREYLLSGKLTVIGRSRLATVRLRGWFAPRVAAQINKRSDGYYLGLGDRIPSINGQPIRRATRLQDGDIIEIGRVRLRFRYAA